MYYLKGMIIGVTVGMVAGVLIGTTNYDLIYNTLKKGKREIKRFKKKYVLG